MLYKTSTNRIIWKEGDLFRYVDLINETVELGRIIRFDTYYLRSLTITEFNWGG